MKRSLKDNLEALTEKDLFGTSIVSIDECIGQTAISIYDNPLPPQAVFAVMRCIVLSDVDAVDVELKSSPVQDCMDIVVRRK